MLGIGIAGYVNVFEPDRLAIGGGLSRASTCFSTAPSRRPTPARFPRCGSAPTIALAEGGADAGVIGAAVLAAQEVARARY